VYKLSDETAHVYVYGMGTVTRRWLAAIISKSPYMRRLQAVRYFSDLYGILETTYEQHVQGTAEIASRYTHEYLRMMYNLVENSLLTNRELLKRLAGSKREPDAGVLDASIRALSGVYGEYVERVGLAAKVSTLIGMLAAPPFRRPFGTILKRRAMKLLAHKIYIEGIKYYTGSGSDGNQQAGSQVLEILKSMRDSIVGFYEELLGTVKPERGKYAGLLPSLRALLEACKGLEVCEDFDGMEAREEAIVDSMLEDIRGFYKSRLTPFEEKSGYEYKYKITSLIYPALFTLRFRNLGTALGAGHAIKAIAEYLDRIAKMAYTRAGHAASGGAVKEEFCEVLRGILDILFQVGDAILINNSSTLLLVSDVARLECQDSGGARESYYVNTILGMPAVVLSDRGLFMTRIGAPRQSWEAGISKPEAGGFQRVNLGARFRRKCRIVDLEGLLEDENVEEVFLTYPYFESSAYIDMRSLPCCIISPLDERRQGEYRRYLNSNIDPGVLRLAAYIFDLMLPRRDRRQASGGRDEKRRWRRKILESGVSPFVSHFKVNQVQADATPSAYHLDLLNKLDKDINIGLRIDLRRLNDIVFNMDNYSFTVFNALNTIYTFLLKDVATVMLRMRLMNSLSQASPCTLKTRKKEISIEMLDLIAILYYYLISREFEELETAIKGYLVRLERFIETLGMRGSRDIGECLGLLKSIRSIIGRYSNFIGSYRRLTSIVALELVRRRYHVSLESLEKLADSLRCSSGISLRDLSFSDFSDFFVRGLLGVPEAAAENQSGGRQLVFHGLISILDMLNRSGCRQRDLVGRCGGYNVYNMLAFYISVGLQQALSTSLSAYLAEYANRQLKRLFGSPRLRVRRVAIQAPSQGVLKPFFHLPVRQSALPRLIEGADLGHLALEHCKRVLQNEKGEEKERLVKYVGCIVDYLRLADYNLYSIDVGTLSDLAVTGKVARGVSGEVIVPDEDYWEILAMGATKSDLFLEHRMSNPKSRPRLFYGNLYFLYTIVVEVGGEGEGGRGGAIGVSVGGLKHALEDALVDAMYELLVGSTLSPPFLERPADSQGSPGASKRRACSAACGPLRGLSPGSRRRPSPPIRRRGPRGGRRGCTSSPCRLLVGRGTWRVASCTSRGLCWSPSRPRRRAWPRRGRPGLGRRPWASQPRHPGSSGASRRGPSRGTGGRRRV